MARISVKKNKSSEVNPQKSPDKGIRVTRATTRKTVAKDTSNIRKRPQRQSEHALRKPRVLNNRSTERAISQTESESQQKHKDTVKPRTRVRNKEASLVKKDAAAKHKVGKVKKGQGENNIKKGRMKNTANKNSSSFRQMSLRESFLNQSKSKRLRPRRKPKNYQEETMLSEKEMSNVEKGDVDKPKIPIYKCIPVDDSLNNKDEVYEFKPDKDDIRNQIKRKKKRAARQNVVQKLLKARALQKAKEQQQKQGNQTAANVERLNARNKVNYIQHKEQDGKVSIETKVVGGENKNINEPVQEQTGYKPETETAGSNRSDGPEENVTDLANSDKTTVKQPSQEFTNDNVQKESVKPTIVSVENLKQKRVTIVDNLSPAKTDDFQPFRPTNVFNNRLSVPNKSGLNASLLDKSLSPILKTTRIFDPGSPWRAPPLFTFSQVRGLYQSTPQKTKPEIVVGKIQRTIDESKNLINSTKVKESMPKAIGNVDTEKSLIINSQKKKSTSTRKFGTEITNIDQSAVIEAPTINVSEKVAIEPDNQMQNTDSSSANDINWQESFPRNDENDKENSVLNYQTPNKIIKKKAKRIEGRSPLKALVNTSGNFNKENTEPVAGPSGLQNTILNKEQIEQRTLRQSNLNNFLNLVDVPESTIIKTRHGIFDDTDSKPVNSKPTKKAGTEDDIVSAFGFTENDTDIENNKENVDTTNIKNVTKARVPARLSIGEIRNHLLLKNKRKDKGENREAPLTVTEGLKKSPSKTKSKTQYDVHSFSDTFDILSDAGDLSSDKGEISLFADLEPSHFTEPPKHSYKRKRQVKFSFSGDSENEEEEDGVHTKVKRKKAGKLSKQDQDRLEAWVKDVNRTFEEIDEFDLVVE